jgi:hypothetical protein
MPDQGFFFDLRNVECFGGRALSVVISLGLRIAPHNLRSDRLSLCGGLHKSLVINGFHHTHKRNYKEESVRKSHRVSNAAKAEFSTAL